MTRTGNRKAPPKTFGNQTRMDVHHSEEEVMTNDRLNLTPILEALVKVGEVSSPDDDLFDVKYLAQISERFQAEIEKGK